MSLLPALPWLTSYRHEDGDPVKQFYVPALSCAVRYDRLTGYFSAGALALAARGIEELILNDGHMRLVVGCTLDPAECEALEAGYASREDPEGYLASEVAKRLSHIKLEPPDGDVRDALGALAWLISVGRLDIRVAVPIDPQTGRPTSVPGIYHEKVGVITDTEGNQLSFSGSINETEAGWVNNRESFHVHCSWEDGRERKHVEDEVEAFAKLWEGRAKSVRTLDFPEAAKEKLLEFLPKDDRFVAPPKKEDPPIELEVVAEEGPLPFTPAEVRRLVWSYVVNAAKMPHGIRVGEATSAVTAWPHQQRAFKRMWDAWPVRMLEASEVGLGKTTIAGLLVRQAWLSGRAKRILIMVPAAVITQWVSELYEKFGLLVPVYDGQKLIWRVVPGYFGPTEKTVGRTEWFNEPIVLVSSHLVRRRDRAEELLSADEWDLVILDEAHHARRRGAGTAQESGPNMLLRLMQRLAPKTRSLMLLTATPMQVAPVEVFDLVNLLGLPEEWDEASFIRYFELLSKPNPSNDDLTWLARMFRATERAFGETEADVLGVALGGASSLLRQKVMKALREEASSIPLKQLDAKARMAAIEVLKRATPVRARMSRYTRPLLRRYREEGLIDQSIATREVRDEMLEMSNAERELYRAVDEYISTTYDAAKEKEKNAVGFILTVYRRRLASSVQALKKTLLRRLQGLETPITEEDAPDNTLVDEILSPDEARDLAERGLRSIEADDIRMLLKQAEKVGHETKAKHLVSELKHLFERGYDSAIIFTMYTDTMEWLADFLGEMLPRVPIGTYSGSGGRVLGQGGTWSSRTKEQMKLALKNKTIRLLIATDAAGEGLNLQFCGALVNYDLPWNPMKIEQRIGRIDRIGQAYERIQIRNLSYRDTIETDIYVAVGQRISLSQGIVGKMQPILSRLPRQIEQAALARPDDRERIRQELIRDLETQVTEAEQAGFDIDEVAAQDISPPSLPPTPIRPEHMEMLLAMPECLPPGWVVRPLDTGSFGLLATGRAEIRITPRPTLFDDHPESMAWFAPGAPLVRCLIDELGGDIAEEGELGKEIGEGAPINMLHDGMDQILEAIRAGKKPL